MREDLKRWLDNLVRVKKEEMELKNFSDECSICTTDWIHLYKCGRYIAEMLEIPYKVEELENYTHIEFEYNGFLFTCLEVKEEQSND